MPTYVAAGIQILSGLNSRRYDMAPGIERSAERRVRRPKDKEKLLERLTEERVFESYRDALAFAATLGHTKQLRKPFDKSSEPIAWTVFANAGLEPLINMIAFVETSDSGILESRRF